MIASTFTIPDGTTLTQARDRDGRMFGVDPVTKRTCTYVGDQTAGRLVDSAGELVREIVAAGKAQEPKEQPPARDRTSKQEDRKRWRTFNTFVDQVARHLEAHEQAAWTVLFRWTRDDVAEIRIADIATRIGKSTRTAQRAVDRLTEVGLLQRLKRGTRQGGASRYYLEADPTLALPRLQAGAASQRDTGGTLKVNPKHQKRDCRGAFTT